MSLISLPRLNLEFLMTLKGCVSLIRDPNQTDSVFDIVEGMRNTDASKFALLHIKSDPQVEAIIKERYVPDIPNVEELIKFPHKSLGHTYASYIKESNFQADFYRQIKVEDDISYILLRMRQSHDIWHIVTDFKTDSIGELGLQAFSLAQTRLPLPVILLSGGLLKTLLQSPATLGDLLEKIAIGYRMGAKAKPLLAQKWEENWNKSIDDIRNELNIEIVESYIP